MAIKRIVSTEFWVDDKVVDNFTPEDKLFFLYLLTNPHTTQLGIYHINKKSMSFELGYTIDAINVLLDRFENKYKIIRYSLKTNEIAIKNYLKHSIIKGGKPVEDCLNKEIAQVKDKTLLNYVFNNLKDNIYINKTIIEIINNNTINENENENEVSYHDSYNDTCHDTYDDSLFALFWKEYPKKRDKEKAHKWFKSHKPNKDLVDTMIKQINRLKQTKEWQKDNGQFIPYPTTWLNGKRWEDEINEIKQPSWLNEEIKEEGVKLSEEELKWLKSIE